MPDFGLDLASIADELEADVNVLVRRFVFGVYSRLMRKSPVDTGQFRGNWIISIGAPIGSVFIGQFNKNASTEINSNRQTIEAFNINKDNQLVIQNNLDYAEDLERGRSKQAPQGILDISIREELKAFE